MNKDIFLTILKETLEGEVSGSVIQENIAYYQEYILDEEKKGRTEQDILNLLGDPRLIARTIIDTDSAKDSYESYDATETNEKKGFHTSFDNEKGWKMHYGKFQLNSWYAKLLFFLIMVVILFIIGKIMIFLVPVILPIIVVLFLVSLLKKR